MNEERYEADISALMECSVRGVSLESLLQLMGECGIDKADYGRVINWQQQTHSEEEMK